MKEGKREEEGNLSEMMNHVYSRYISMSVNFLEASAVSNIIYILLISHPNVCTIVQAHAYIICGQIYVVTQDLTTRVR